MHSAHYAYAIGVAIKSQDERRFKAAVQSILASNASIYEELAIWQLQVRSGADSRTLQGMIQALENSENILLELHIESVAYTDMFLDAHYQADGAQMQFALTMRRWLAGQLVAEPVRGRPQATNSEKLFEAAARWFFWFHVLGPQESRTRFATSAATSGANDLQHLAKRGALRLLMHVRLPLLEALATLAFPADEYVLPSIVCDQAISDSDWNNRMANELIRSTAPDIGHNVTGVVRGYDVEVTIALSQYGKRDSVTLDTGCVNSTIARGFLTRMHPDVHVIPLRYPWVCASVIRDADDIDKFYANLDIFLDAEVRGRRRQICINHDVIVSDQYDGNMLFGMDLIYHHGIIIDPVRKVMTVTQCQNALVPLDPLHVKCSQVVEDPDELVQIARVERQIALRAMGHTNHTPPATSSSNGSSEDGQDAAHGREREEPGTGDDVGNGVVTDE